MMSPTTIHPLKIVAAVGAAFLVWGLVLAYASSPAWANDITVTSTDDVAGNDGKCTLREAITSANNDPTLEPAAGECANGSGDDIIKFALPGTAPWTVNLSAALPDLSTNIELVGPGARQLTVRRNTESTFRIFTVTGTTTDVTISGITISNGFDGNGGGIYNDGGTLTVRNSTLSGSQGGVGGAIYNDGGTLTVSRSILSGNHAGSGGGIQNLGTTTVRDSTLSENHAVVGGGILNHNTLDSGQVASSRLEVHNSTFSKNSADFGGGIYNDSSATATVSNSTLSGNSATASGGGIDNFGTATVSYSTLSGNSATAGGGGIEDGGEATLENTIVANSTGSDCSGASDGGYNLVEDGPGCLAVDTTSLFGVDPMLGALAPNNGPTQTHALLPPFPFIGTDISPAMDAIPVGKNGCATTTQATTQDQRGLSRPQGSRLHGSGCDIGAFEVDQPPTVTIDQASSQADPTTDSPILFTAVFNEPVTGFTGSDVDLSGGTAVGPLTAEVTEKAPKDGTAYDVAVSGMTSDGTVIASIPFRAAEDTTRNNSDVSTSTDNTVTFTGINSPPTYAVTNGQCSINAASGTINLTLNDPDGDPLTLKTDPNAPNSNPTLVPNNNIKIGGSGNNRTLSVTAAPKKSGTATLTFNLSDGTVTVPVRITVIVGSDKNETLAGTSGTDMIFGLGGKNTINGNDGNDLLCGGNGNDTINGGGGNDIIDGANGNDVLRGDAGNDILRGSTGDDSLTGGADADSFSGGTGTDTAPDFKASEGDTKDNTIP